MSNIRGLSAVLIRNGPSNIIFFLSPEYVKNSLPSEWIRKNKWTSGLTDFFCGICSNETEEGLGLACPSIYQDIMKVSKHAIQ